MSVIVDIDHEIGDLTEYTSTVTDGGDLSVAAAAALAGTVYGLNVLIDDTTAIYGIKSGLNDTSGKLRARFYIDPNTLTMATDDQFIVWRAQNTSTASLAKVDLYRSAAPAYRIQVTIFNDAGAGTASSFYTITDEPHYIEIYLQRAATSISSDGSLQLWIDGVSKQTISGIDNYDRFPNFDIIHLGAIANLDAGTSGTLYLDQLVVNDDGSEIGAYVPPAAGNPWYAYAQM